MNTQLRYWYTFILLLSSSFVFGQQIEFIAGRLVDSKTLEPIPYASIRIVNKNIGIISNSDGGFKIPVDFKKNADAVEISSLGYKTKEVFLSSFVENQIYTIALFENVEALNEVVVTTSKKRKRLTAREIVQLAIEKIDKNFPTEPSSYVGYYRDYQLKDGTYLNLNEAVLAIFDPGFGFEDLKETQTVLFKYTENQDFERDSVASQTYDYANRTKVIPEATISGRIRNEYTRLRLHDAIRNYNIHTYSFIDRLDRDLIKNHKLKLTADSFFDGIPLYTIKISKVVGTIEVIGTLFIEKSNFGIHKLAYAVYEKEPPKYRKGPFWNIGVKTMDNGTLGRLLYDIKVEYRSRNNKLYLNYISFKNAFDILLPPKFAPIAAEIDGDRKCFKLIMNNPPLRKDALKTKNYSLYYQKQKLNIERIEMDKNTIYVYPKNAKVVFNPKLVRQFRSRNLLGVSIEINNVEDVYGNMVHESEAIQYEQFREFFTQKLTLGIKEHTDSLYMKKAIPLNGNQPIVPPTNISDYWMNTPLKN